MTPAPAPAAKPAAPTTPTTPGKPDAPRDFGAAARRAAAAVMPEVKTPRTPPVSRRIELHPTPGDEAPSSAPHVVEVDALSGGQYLARHVFGGGLSTFAGPAEELRVWLLSIASVYSEAEGALTVGYLADEVTGGRYRK